MIENKNIDEQIKKNIDSQISFLELKISMLEDKKKEVKKELNALKKTKKHFLKTGIIEIF